MTITCSATLADALVTALPASRTLQTLPVPTLPGDQTRWDTRAVPLANQNAPRAFYPDALPPDITWNLNVPDTFDVQIPIDDSNLGILDPDDATATELEVWRNGHRLIVGKVTKRRADPDTRMMLHSAADPTWYFSKRNIGRANRPNLLKNEGDGIGGATLHPWHEHDPGSVMTFTIDSARKLTGTHSFKLVATDQSAPYIFQRYALPFSAFRRNLFLVAWAFIDAWTAPAIFDAGVLLIRLGATGPRAYAYAPVKVTTAREQWVRLETNVSIPPNHAETVEARLFAIKGTIRYTTIRLTADQHLGWGDGTDQGIVIADTLAYLQGRGKFAHLAPEKSDLHIQTAIPASTGVEVQAGLRVNLSDHRKAFDGVTKGSGFLDHYLNAPDGIDWWLDPNGKILRGYYPSRGVDRTDVTFTYRRFPNAPERNASWGIKSWGWADSIEAAANQITELSSTNLKPGDPSREEGGYTDASTLGGITLELVESTPQGMPISQLRGRATARGRRLKHPIGTPQIVVVEPRDRETDEVVYPLIGVLMPGDLIAVDIVDGDFVLNGNMRVAQVFLSGVNEELTVTLNPVFE